MPLRNLVVVALLICAVAGVITAIADKGQSGVASVAKATPAKKQRAAGTPRQTQPFHGRTVYVTMRRLAFAPGTIHIRIGDRVVWRNRDNVGHNVTTQEDPAGVGLVDLASPTIKPGSAYAYVAHYAGRASYVCTFHPTTMHATIIVSRRS